MSEKGAVWPLPVRLIHWASAALIIGALALGATMVQLVQDAAERFDLTQTHKGIGVTVLAVTVLRLCVRIATTAPPPAALPTRILKAAKVAHHGIYALLVVTPQLVAHRDAHRMLGELERSRAVLLGGVENMATQICPNCGETRVLFPPAPTGETIWTRIPKLASVPFSAQAARDADRGRPVMITRAVPQQVAAYQLIAREIRTALAAAEGRSSGRPVDPAESDQQMLGADIAVPEVSGRLTSSRQDARGPRRERQLLSTRASTALDTLRDRLAGLVFAEARLDEDHRREPVRVSVQRQQQVLGADVVVAPLVRDQLGVSEGVASAQRQSL